MPKAKKDILKNKSIYINDKLKARVQKAADKDGRSFSDFVCRVLDKHVK
jgi:hypothetical protein